jgi:hypothetical protein
MRELLDLQAPLNRQSFNYAARRGYLESFPEYIRSKGVKVIAATDYGLGSRFISGYQVLVWGKND